MKTSIEIREHLLGTLNDALPRLSTFGGEIAACQLLSHLAFIDDCNDELRDRFDALRDRGAFTASGVAGAFNRQTGLKPTDNEIGSVYADVAFRMGYLRTQRTLTPTEFDSLESKIRESCPATDYNADEVRAQFGAPSWQSGANPYYPWVYLYLCQDRDHGIAFDFWNVIRHDKQNEVVRGDYGDIPVLRNVRIGAVDFGSEFTFTPIGRRIVASTQIEEKEEQ